MNLISPSYAFATSLIKAEESRSATAMMMKEAMGKLNLEDAISSLKGSSIGEYLDRNATKTFDQVNASLHTYMDHCLERIFILRPPADMVLIAKAYMVKFDIINIKVALRRLLDEEEAPFIPAGMIHHEGLLEELSGARSFLEIASVLEKCSLNAYAGIVEKQEGLELRDIVKVETELDITYFTELHGAIRHLDDADLLDKALGIMIDTVNLRILLRSVLREKSLQEDIFIPGGETLSAGRLALLAGIKVSELISALDHTRYAPMVREICKSFDADKDIRAVERVSDAFQIRVLKELLTIKVFSPAMVLSLLVVKEWEVRSVRLVLKAVCESIPASTLTSYLEV